jgi:hypothetical protein
MGQAMVSIEDWWAKSSWNQWAEKAGRRIYQDGNVLHEDLKHVQR